MRITVWCEGVHAASKPELAEVYPDGMERTIAQGLTALLPDATVDTGTLAAPDAGLPSDVLDRTDVLFWWGHLAHDRVPAEVVERVRVRVLSGMGLVVLHSGHFSKVFTTLMGTTCSLRWRNSGDREVIWNVAPSHPVTQGVGPAIVLAAHETYAEYFDVPTPDDVVFISNFSGGEVFRSGLTFTRGHGRIFYFSPGDEAYPVFYDAAVQRILANAAMWAAPSRTRSLPTAEHVEPDWFAATTREA